MNEDHNELFAFWRGLIIAAGISVCLWVGAIALWVW